MINYISYLQNSTKQVFYQKQQLWMKAGIILGLFLLTAFITFFFASTNRLMLILGSMGALFSGLILIRWPPIGIFVACVFGLVMPDVLPQGITPTMLLIPTVTIIWILDIVLNRKSAELLSSRIVWSMIALVFVFTISFIAGQLKWIDFAQSAPLDAQVGGYGIYVLSILACLVSAYLIRDLVWLKAIVWGFFIFGIIYVFGVTLPGLNQLTRALYTAIGGLFWIWFVSLLGGQLLFNRKLSPVVRWIFIVVLLLSLYTLLVRKFEDKSGWLPVLACLGVLIYLRSWRLGVFIAVLTVLGGIGFSATVIDSESYSLSTRFEAWTILAEIIKASPIIGLGFANYYWITPLFPIRGYAVSFNSHNNFVDIIAQTGLAGLLLFLWFFWEIGVMAWNFRKKVTDDFSKGYVNGAIAGLIGTLVIGMLGDWLLPFLYNIGLNGFGSSILGWFFLGGLIALINITSEQKRVGKVSIQ